MDYKKIKKAFGRRTKKQMEADKKTKPTGIPKNAKSVLKYQERIQKFKGKLNG